MIAIDETGQEKAGRGDRRGETPVHRLRRPGGEQDQHGDEVYVYGGCARLREFSEENGQAYVLRVASSFMITVAPRTKVTCADAVRRLVKDSRCWEVCSAGKGSKGKGSKGKRWYAWAWIATASPRHHLLVPPPP